MTPVFVSSDPTTGFPLTRFLPDRDSARQEHNKIWRTACQSSCQCSHEIGGKKNPDFFFFLFFFFKGALFWLLLACRENSLPGQLLQAKQVFSFIFSSYIKTKTTKTTKKESKKEKKNTKFFTIVHDYRGNKKNNPQPFLLISSCKMKVRTNSLSKNSELTLK